MIDVYNKLEWIDLNYTSITEIYHENSKYMELIMTTKPFIILGSYLIFENCCIYHGYYDKSSNIELQLHIPDIPTIKFGVIRTEYVKHLNKCLMEINESCFSFNDAKVLLETEIRKQKLKRLCN